MRLAARGTGRREVDWPSACTPLNALCKVAPAGVRGRFPVMHDVARRIIYRPALSKATESERVMVSKVAEGLEVRIIHTVAPALRPRVTSFGDPRFVVQGTGLVVS